MKYVPHDTVEMDIDGFVCPIDKGVVKLIKTMNEVQSGITTHNCCQGGSDNWVFGYVMFDSRDEGDDAAIVFMTSMMREMEAIWMNMTPKTRQKSKFYFMAEIGDLYIMRWAPETYKYVLKSAKKLLTGCA